MDRVEIKDDDQLYRRIHPSNINPQTNEVSSSAFVGADTFNLSVDLAKLTTPQQVMAVAARFGRECIGVAAFTAGDARRFNFEVRHDPLPAGDPDGPNPAHTLVIGDKERPGRKPAKNLARCCRWVWPEDRLQYNPQNCASESSEE